MILYVHVHDIIVGGESEVCDALYSSLLQEFQTTQGNSSWHLGCAIGRNKAGGVLRMTQRAFLESVSSRYGVDAVSGLRAEPNLIAQGDRYQRRHCLVRFTFSGRHMSSLVFSPASTMHSP